MTDSPTIIIAGGQDTERFALSRWPRARVAGIFRDLSLVEYMLSGLRPDIVLVDPSLPARGESLQQWVSRSTAAFPGVSFVLLDGAGAEGNLPLSQHGLGGLTRSESTRPGSVLVAQTIVVWSPKGGVGKTFLATNLACAAAVATGGQAALLDLDLYSGDASVHLDLLDGPTITEALTALGDMRPDVLDKYSHRHEPSRLNVIASPRRPELSDLVTTEHVRTVLALAAKRWALVYVDTPPDITSDVVGECIDAASKIVLVVTQDVATLRQSKVAIDIFEKLGLPRDSVAVVVNRCSKESLMPVAKVQEFLGAEIVGVIPDERRAVERSVFEGKPVVLSGKSELSEAVWKVAARLTPGLSPAHTARPLKPRRGFFW